MRLVYLLNMLSSLNKDIIIIIIMMLCSDNRGADQLHSYCTADLHLCFGICKK